MMEEKHRGHDLMHAEMVIILFASISVAQVLLFIWKQKRPRWGLLGPYYLGSFNVYW